MAMLLHLDRIPRLHNILAAAFGWILLAGFLVIPGTFTALQKSEAYQAANDNEASQVANTVVKSIDNVPLVYVSAFLSGIGALGCIWLWLRWRKNYVWLINRVFLPTLMSSLAGVLSTVVNVYSAQEGVWSVTAKIAAIVTGSCAGVSLALFCLYNFWALKGIKKRHEEEFPEELKYQDTQRSGKSDSASKRAEKQKNRESLVEKVKRKAHEPPIQPGSVV
ncbi:uncharacterized protein HMPREF1541_02594 [Cyphellophora europaea CBS 101466]|uniref:Uncharacterized protein n=1 Tax=Cyphellophora europaea (strain CBS 101466) TaxID=1220924 RepID=W2S4C6_CYPE1|nr:uncharacterized protein HMPREF1541_02594 [Cyphellophora europaea CBS 101466]ETN43435.1 hypothetical protein HMPREF1541_02594 [Cyphellophora europaea CBS 101466]